jgi:PAS domain S-box-containing protein
LTIRPDQGLIGNAIAQTIGGTQMDDPESYAHEGLELLDVGVAIFDKDTRLVFANRAFHALRRYPDDLCREGVTLEALLRFNAERGDFGPGDIEVQIADRLAEIDQAEEREIEREMADGQVLRIRYRRTASGGLVVTFDDRTDERRAQAKLALSEERHTLVSRATSDGIYDWNVTDDLLYVSDALSRLFNFDQGVKASSAWAERVHEGDYNHYITAIQAHFKGDTNAIECEYRVRGKGGVYRWIQDRGIGVRDKDGRVTRLVGAVRDITDIKEARAELDRTEARLLSSLATISDGILLVDGDNRVQLWNDRYIEIFTEAVGGADISEVITKGRPFFDMIRDGYNLGMFKPHPDGVDAWVAARTQAWEQPASQWELELANGTWLLLNERQMPDGGRVSVYTDITELKQREVEAQAARERFEEAIEAISTGFVLFDAKDQLVVWNTRFQEYFSEMADVFKPGVPFREIISSSIRRGLFPAAMDDPDEFLDNMMERRAKGVGQVRENLLNNSMWLQITDHRTKDGGLVSIYTDITGLKTSEQESQAARERFEEAIEAISAGFTLWDKDDRLVICNSKYREFYQDLADIVKPGARFRDILLKGAELGLLPEASGDPAAYVEANAAKREAAIGTIREHRLANGRWLQVTDHRTADGGIVSIHTDVTELKNREAEISKQSAILELTLENMGQGITMVDRDLNTVAFNTKFREMFQYPEEQFGRVFSMEQAFRFNAERGEYGPGDIDEQVRERLELTRKFLPHRFERSLLDGTVVEIVGNPIEGGGFVSTYTDITERKQADEALKAALEEFNAVLDNIDYGVLFMGPDLRARIVNRAFRELWNMPQDFIAENPSMRELIEYNRYNDVYLVAPEKWDEWIEDRVEAIKVGTIPPWEMVRADGKVLSYQCVDLPGGGRMLTYFDITGLKKAEQVSRDSEARLRGILENSPIGVAVIDDDNFIRFHNPRFPEILGGAGEDLVGTSSKRFWTDMKERDQSLKKYREAGRVTDREVMYRGMDGRDVWSLSTYERAEWEGMSARLIWIYDITEEKANREALVVARDEAEAALTDLQKAQERLVQAEKMASLGQLTAGIAHEIKNPLNFVNNFAKLSDELLEELGEILEEPIKALDDEARDDAEDLFKTVRENLTKINEHGRRADSIVKNMLLHSREGPSERQSANLNAIAEEALNLAYHGARAENPQFNIEMVKALAEDVGAVECFPQDLMRVFLNLMTNGMYAAHKRGVEEGAGFAPAISLTTRTTGGQIEIEVRDNGSGIPVDVREKIFVPFFTTKPAGEGTGLGLSLSYDIVVKQHGGEMTVDSEPGEFTAFRVTLPRTLPTSLGEHQ